MPISRKHIIVKSLEESARLKRLVAKTQWKDIENVARLMVSALRGRKKLLLFGNGGSAADAQHIAAEFVNRFMKDRRPLPALALTTDTSVLTSIGNDADFSFIFSKQIEALGKKGDIAMGISTSGDSGNLIQAFISAKWKGMIRIGLLGRGGGMALRFTDHAIVVPSDSTPRIQEAHIAIGHILCEIIEREMFPS